MEIGATVVVRGYFIGTVSAIRDGVIVVDERDLGPGEERQLEVVADGVRPLVDRAHAERVLDLLRAPGERLTAKDERAIAYRRACKRSDLDECAKLLAASYVGQAEVPEHQYQERLEKIVYGELGLVLGMSRKQLRAKMRSATRGEAAPRSLALADRSAELAATKLPAMRGREPIGAFAVDGKLAVGEGRADVVIEVDSGIWLAYARRTHDDIAELVAVHQDAFKEQAALAKQAKSVGRAGIDGAHIAIFDEAIADDHELVQAMLEATFDVIEGRAVSVALGGDGSANVFAAAKRYVRVQL